MQEKINKVIALITQYGGFDGSHHKQWVLDQVVRILLDSQYDKWLKENEDYWNEGIPP